MVWGGYLNLSGCYNENTVDLVTHKLQRGISHSFGAREVQAYQEIWCLMSACFLACRQLSSHTLTEWREQVGTLASIYKGTNPIRKGSTLMI